MTVPPRPAAAVLTALLCVSAGSTVTTSAWADDAASSDPARGDSTNAGASREDAPNPEQAGASDTPAEQLETGPWATPVEPPLEETPEHLPPLVERRTSGVEVAIRAGYFVPLGSSAASSGIRNHVVGMIPLRVDAGYRFSPHLWVGAFGAAGLGVKGEYCDDDPPPTDGEVPSRIGPKCDAPNQFRLGAQVQWHFLPSTADVAPWIGLGVGYQWLNISETLGRRTFVQTFAGPDYLHLELGVDLAVGSRVRLGPYAHWNLGEYAILAAAASEEAAAAARPTSGVHQWLGFGIKATVGPYGR